MDNPTADGEGNLRKRKLRLETKLLVRQLRPAYQCLEIAKGVANVLTLFGIVVTLFLGVQQIKDARRSNEDERFDKAVARLAGSTPTERLAGVVGLGLYLEPQEKARHRATLRFFVNALAVEPDPIVRGELLDRLAQLTPSQVAQDDLDDALERLRDRNRSLYGQQYAVFMDKYKRGIVTLPEKGNDETYIGNLSEDDLAPLRATASALAELIRNGARAKDLSGIYCLGCDFSGKTLDMSKPDFPAVADFAHADAAKVLDLSGVNFNGAILQKANFVGVRLRGASFDSADLIGANFSGADLADAKLTDFGREYIIQSMVATGHLWGAMFPDFTCADLSGADFSGSVLFGIYRDSPNPMYAIFHNANLMNTKLGQIKVITASPVPPNYNPTPPEKISTFLFNGYNQGVGSWANIKDWDEQPNVVDVFLTGPAFRIREQVPAGYWLGVQLVFSNLASARNLDKSELPQGIKEFISRNQKAFSNSPHPTPCTPKS